MTKAEVIEILEQKHQMLYDWLESHPTEQWVKGPQGKWNTGEHIVHLFQTEHAINRAFWLPRFYLKYKFGTNNRENRNYQQIAKKYKDKLAGNPGVVANISKKMPTMTLSMEQLPPSLLVSQLTMSYYIVSASPWVLTIGTLPNNQPKRTLLTNRRNTLHTIVGLLKNTIVHLARCKLA